MVELCLIENHSVNSIRIIVFGPVCLVLAVKLLFYCYNFY
jgi:hypothetical protein